MEVVAEADDEVKLQKYMMKMRKGGSRQRRGKSVLVEVEAVAEEDMVEKRWTLR